ncbi:MAG: MarR family winged helix-turn-helix transcriptional regulator [Acidimicrobiales bacterium]
MDETARAAVAKEVTQALAELFFSAENQQRFHGTADELGLTLPMLKGLLALEPGSGLPMRSLAELWHCDASFVTVMVDGLEHRGLVERRVADYDRRIKTVELTPEGAATRERALDLVYAPRAGFLALTTTEQAALAKLLRKMIEAQAAHDEQLLDDPEVRAGMRTMRQQRTRDYRARAEGPGSGSDWRAHLEQHRDELRRLKREVDRVKADMKAQARRAAEDARAAKDEAKAAARDAAAPLSGGGRRR